MCGVGGGAQLGRSELHFAKACGNVDEMQTVGSREIGGEPLMLSGDVRRSSTRVGFEQTWV